MISKKNRVSSYFLVIIFFVMLGLSFASVPLFKIFCSLTGFQGTTQIATHAPSNIIDHKISTRFDTNIGKGLSWDFKPDKNQEIIKVGQVSNVKFKITNLSNEETVAVATFNVTPEIAGKYFNKISCFCFEQQTLKAKQTKELQLVYFVDPKIVDDLSAKQIKDITLSYTFFEVANFEKLEKNKINN